MTATGSTGYIAISRRTLDLEDYIDVARRHPAWILAPTFAGLVISTVVAFMVQNVYVSQATLEITPKQISDSIVKSTTTNELSDRMSEMQQEILSRTGLSSIITDPNLNLYKDERASMPVDDVIDIMRRDIRITIDTVPGQQRTAAFTIAFSYRDPNKARDTVQRLITKFEDANLNAQHQEQQAVGSFVHDELSDAKTKLDQLEEELTQFRTANAGKLPEQESLNMSEMTALQNRLGSLNDSLNRAEQEKVQLQARLAELQNDMTLVETQQKDLDAGGPAAQKDEQLADLTKQINDKQIQLAQLQQTYRPDFPDIREAQGRLDVLKKQQDQLQKQDATAAAKPADAPNKTVNLRRAEAVNNLDGQIKTTQALLKTNEMQEQNARKEQQTASSQLQTFEARLAATSAIEAKYVDMKHAADDAREKYQTLEQKQQLAEQNNSLVERKAMENLLVLDNASLPTQPTAPKRWEYIGGGTAIAFIVGLALAGLQEAKDTSLKNLKDVRAYTNLPVLSSIPLLENTMLVRRKRRLAFLAWSAAVIIGMLAVTASLYYHYVYVA